MPRTAFFIVALVLAPCLHWSVAQQEIGAKAVEESYTAARKASPDLTRARDIDQRAHRGEPAALREMTSLDLLVAIPLLGRYALDKTTDPQAAQVAVETLKQVHGVRDYFRSRITRLHKAQGDDFATVREFKTLALIGSREAVAATASFLFDTSEPTPTFSDVGVDSLKYQALSTLLEMKLPNAPTSKPSFAANEDDLQKWRDWWLAHKAEYEQ